jgi:adhesin HecA-like repeat protein
MQKATAGSSDRRGAARCNRRALAVMAAVLAQMSSSRAFAATDDHWNNPAGGTWDVPSNWDLGVAPTDVNYDAIIDLQTSNPYEIDIVNGFSSAGITLNSANLTVVQTALSVTTPTLTLNAGTYELTGGGRGYLTGATITANGGALSGGQQGGTLDGVTIASDLTLYGSQLYFQDGLTLSNNSTVTVLSSLFSNSQTQSISGTGTINLSDTGASLASYGGELTLGSGISVISSNGNGGTTGLGVFDYGAIVNSGTINATNASNLVVSFGTLTNNGIISADSGSEVDINGGTLSNTGTLLAAAGGTISIGGFVAATNLGFFTTNGGAGTVQLGNGGNLYIADPSINTGTVFTLTDILTLNGGTITGGIIQATGAGSLSIGPNGGTLDGVTLAGNQTVSGSQLTILDDLTLHGTTVSVSSGGSLYLANQTQSIDGYGTIELAGNGSSLAVYGGTVSLGSSITVIADTPDSTELGVYSNGTLINSGFIFATGGASLAVAPGTFINSGVLAAANSSTLTIGSGTFANSGTISADSGSTVSINAYVTAADLGYFTTNGGAGTVQIGNNGNLVNTGNNLILTDYLTLDNGTITGGTISTSGVNAALLIGPNGGTLDGVTLATDVSYTTANVQILDGLTLDNSTLSITSIGSLYFDDGNSQTIGAIGIGTINLSGGASLAATGGTLTIGSGINVVSANPTGASLIGSNNAALINNGSISAINGATIDVYFASVTNTGIISAATGSEVRFDAGTLDNSNGTLDAHSGGTISIGVALTSAQLGNFQTDGGTGTVELTGTLDNTNATLALTDILTLNGGEIDGGSLFVSGAGSLQFGANGGTLSGVTLVGFPIPANATITGGLTIQNQTITLDGNNTLSFDNTGPFVVGDGAAVNQSGSSVATYGGGLVIAPNSGDTASYNLSGGTLNGKVFLLVAPNGTGVFTQIAGDTITGVLSAGNNGTIGGGSGGTNMNTAARSIRANADSGDGTGHGTINISGGTLYADTILLGSTSGGTGDMTVSGTANVTVGGGAHLNDLNVNGGTFTVLDQAPPAGEDPELNRAIVGGYLTNGALNVNGGTVVSPLLKLGITSQTTGTFTETSGTVTLDTLGAGNDGTLTSGSGKGIVNVSGGSLYADTVLLGSTAGGSGAMTVSSTASVTIGGGAHLNDLNVTGGSVTVLDQAPPANEDPELNRALVGGYLTNGALIVSNGTVTSPNIKLGITQGMTGTFNLSGGTVDVGTLGVGNDASMTSGSGIGKATVSGGSLIVSTLLLGSTAGGSGDMTVSDTASVTIGGGAHLNDLNVIGGTVTVLDQDPPSGEDPELDRALVGGYLTNGALNVSGGTVTTPYIKLGITGKKTGTFSQTEGVVSVGTLAIGDDASLTKGTGFGIANLSGGTLSVGTILIGSSAGGIGSLDISASASVEVTSAITGVSGAHFNFTGGNLTLNGATFSVPPNPCNIGDGTHAAELHVHNSTVSLSGATVAIAANATLDGGSGATSTDIAPQNVGLATFSNTNLSFSGSSSTLHLTLGGDPAAANAGTGYDQIDISNGVFTVGGATLQMLPLSNVVLNEPYPIVVASGGGSIDYSSAFANLATDPAAGTTDLNYSVSYSSAEIDLTVTATPEPGSAALLALSGMIFLRRRKRQR